MKEREEARVRILKMIGAPGWLSWLIVCLQLISGHDLGVRDAQPTAPPRCPRHLSSTRSQRHLESLRWGDQALSGHRQNTMSLSLKGPLSFPNWMRANWFPCLPLCLTLFPGSQNFQGCGPGLSFLPCFSPSLPASQQNGSPGFALD